MARKSRKNTVDVTPSPSLCISTAFYIRLSSDKKQAGDCAIEGQKLILNNFVADKPEFVVYDTYIDKGLTGTNFQRPAFQRMLSDIEAGRIQCVIVKDLSRLGRNTIDTGYYIERYFHTHHVRFIAITDDFDTDDPNNVVNSVILPLKNMVNEAYALDISQKIKSQTLQAMKGGEYVGSRAPYGYRKDPDNCHKLLIDEPAAEVVRQIFQWAYEHVGLNGIVRRLNEAGIDSPGAYKQKTGELIHERLIGSGKWQTRSVTKILSNEVYTGNMVQGKTKKVDHRQVAVKKDELIVVKGTHEPIVNQDIFDAVQAYRKEVADRSKSVSKIDYTPNLFKGKVFCAHCGGALNRQRVFRKSIPDTYWYYCLTNNRVEHGACEGVRIQERDLVPMVTEILEKELSVALGKSLPLIQLEEQQKWKRSRIQSTVSEKKCELEKNRGLIRSLYENYVGKILTEDEYSSLKATYESSVSALSEEIKALEKEMDDLDRQLARCRAMEKDAELLKQDHTLTADLIDRLIERIEIAHDRTVRIDFRFKSEFTDQEEQCVYE